MKTLTNYIAEAAEYNKFYIYARIETSSPYSSFLFANNMMYGLKFEWSDRESAYEEIAKKAIERLEKFHPIFSEFSKPVVKLPDPSRGGSPIATAELDKYTLKLTILYSNERDCVNNIDDTSEPIFKSMTARWSETDREHKSRVESFEKSNFNDFCVEKTGKKFIFR